MPLGSRHARSTSTVVGSYWYSRSRTVGLVDASGIFGFSLTGVSVEAQISSTVLAFCCGDASFCARGWFHCARHTESQSTREIVCESVSVSLRVSECAGRARVTDWMSE